MKFFQQILTVVLALMAFTVSAGASGDSFPDGTDISAWFNDTSRIDIDTLGRKYVITSYGVKNDSTLLQTEAIQRVIDLAAAEGGGVIVVPEGTFLSGSLFFKQGTHLHICRGGVIKGVDAIKYYPLVKTRMEGQTLNYFAALINADGLNASPSLVRER